MSAVWTGKVLSVYGNFFFPDTRLEDKRRVALHITLSLVGIIFLFIFSILAAIQKNIPLATADAAAVMVLAGNLFDLHKRKKIRFKILLGLTIISLLYVFLYATGSVGESA